jgi:hypothetical protein
MIQRYNGSDRRLTYLFDNANHVEVDRIQTAGTPVADITIDGETTRLYAPQGGGGTDVEANPSGTPTADLDTIRIGQVIYDIPGSGGGGSQKFEETLIFDTPTSSTGNITVSSMSDADELIFIIGIFADNDYQVFSNAISMTELKNGERVFIGGTATIANGTTYSKYASVKYVNDTTIAIVDIGGHSWAETGYLYRIYKRRYSSQLAHHYSTSEKIVGTWIDGSTLYERTFAPSSALTNNSWNLNICGTSGSGISIKKFDGSLYGSDYSSQMFPLSYFRSSSEFSTICTNSTRDDINLLPKIDGIGTLHIDHITLQYTKTT